MAAKLAHGENEVLRLTTADRLVYIQAQEDLRSLNRPLNVAVSEYVNAVKRLPPGVNLSEAVDFFVRRNPAELPRKTVREVLDEMLDTKTKAGRGAVHLKDLQSRTRLNRDGKLRQTLGGGDGMRATRQAKRSTTPTFRHPPASRERRMR